MLLVSLPVRSRLLVVKCLGSEKLYVNFQLCRGSALQPLCCLRVKYNIHSAQKEKRILHKLGQKHHISQMSHSIQHLRIRTLSWGPSLRHPGDCAYLLRASGYRSPASHLGTGFSDQGPIAATPLCWNLQLRPWRTLIPVRAHSCSAWIVRFGGWRHFI